MQLIKLCNYNDFNSLLNMMNIILCYSVVQFVVIKIPSSPNMHYIASLFQTHLKPSLCLRQAQECWPCSIGSGLSVPPYKGGVNVWGSLSLFSQQNWHYCCFTINEVQPTVLVVLCWSSAHPAAFFNSAFFTTPKTGLTAAIAQEAGL